MSITGWRAVLADGEVRESTEPGAGLVESSVLEAEIHLDSGSLKVKAQPDLGERVQVSTRRRLATDMQGNVLGDVEDTVVVQITPDPDRPDRFVRLYVGREVVLSTGD